MGFEQPGFLWAGLAALTPVIIHLIGRKRAQIHPFSAIQFILGSNKRIARRLRLRQWLLMAARMLLIAGLAFAFAKPYLIQEQDSLPATQGPTSVVLVVDSSFSMTQLDAEDTLLKQAQDRALEILGSLRRESNVAVIDAGIPVQVLTPGLTFERAVARSAVSKITQKFGRTDMTAALRQAEQLLSQSSIESREILILTDLQASEWKDFTHQWALGRHPRVQMIDVRMKEPVGNVAIENVTVERVEGNQIGELSLSVTIMNAGPKQIEDVISVRIGKRTAKGIIRIPAHGTAQKDFQIQLLDKTVDHGTVEISADKLPGDNLFSFILQNNSVTKVLVVNGAPRSIPHLDEAFFLRAALQPDRQREDRIQTSIVKSDEFSPTQLEYTDVLILANVGEMELHQVQAITQWVENGGGVLLTGGDNATASIWNKTFKDLLPLPLRSQRVLEKDRKVYWSSIDASHRALEPFASLPDASLYSAEVQKYILLDAVPTKDTTILARFTDGSPALVERILGLGRVLMMTTTVDRDWSSLPFKTSFLPLIQQITLYLGRGLVTPRPRNLRVNQQHTLPVMRDAQDIQVLTPDGRSIELQSGSSSETTWSFRQTEQPGIYTVIQGSNKTIKERFSVNVDIRESQTETTAIADIERRLNPTSSSTAMAQKDEQRVDNTLPGRRRNLWPGFLLGLFGLLGFEAWLALG